MSSRANSNFHAWFSHLVQIPHFKKKSAKEMEAMKTRGGAEI
jgi:hypothetical protein